MSNPALEVQADQQIAEVLISTKGHLLCSLTPDEAIELAAQLRLAADSIPLAIAILETHTADELCARR